MVKTRAALTRELGALRGRLHDQPDPADTGGKSTVAEQKRSTRKSSNAKKSNASKSKKTSPAKRGGHSRGVKTGTKAKQVLTRALEGAAIGAVKGAVQAVDTGSRKSKGGRSKKSEE